MLTIIGTKLATFCDQRDFINFTTRLSTNNYDRVLQTLFTVLYGTYFLSLPSSEMQ